jgi:pterin-4a-carbinolamine dehydratase
MPERVLSPDDITRRLAELPGWAHSGGMLRRTFTTDGWRGTMLLVNAIAFLAEAADHHPDLAVGWNRVQVSLATHSAGGITEKDVALARLIDRTALWRPQPGDPFRGPAKPFVAPAPE